MPGTLDILFEIDAGFLEVGPRQARHRGIGLVEFALGADQAHADAAPTCSALENHRVADAGSLAPGMCSIIEQPGTGQQRHTCLLGEGTRRVLEAEGFHLGARRADEGNPGGFAGIRKIGVF